MASQSFRRGKLRRTRRRRAERRLATREVREMINDKMRSQGHHGWTGPDHERFF